MEIIKNIKQVREIISDWKNGKNIIGFVPTMGALHLGHMALVRESKKKCDKTIVSIFVNPTQFGPKEDFNRYPKPLKEDIKILKDLKTDLLFLPETEEMYPGEPGKLLTEINVKKRTEVLCGASRPGHFKGVLCVVAKLFNIIAPHYAFFGMKDYQQLAVIKKMVYDLNFNIKIIPVPIVREKDGLALSSRNRYLSRAERRLAPNLRKVILSAANELKFRKKPLEQIIEKAKRELKKYFKIDYFEIVNPKTLKKIEPGEEKGLIAAAVHLGKTRLIDNMYTMTK